MSIQTGFGWIKIGDITYDRDVVIHTNGTVAKRHKKKSREFKELYSHTPLSENELNILKKERPNRVYIGTGQYGNLPITPGVMDLLNNYHTLILPTPDLILKIGQNERDYLAIIHIT